MSDFDGMSDKEALDAFASIIESDESWATYLKKSAPKQELPPVKPTGLSYTGDSVTAAGEPTSTYLFTWEGKQLFRVYVDLGVTLDLPKGVDTKRVVSAHPIRIVSLDYLTSIDTKGMAFVAKHDDGLVHVDGTSVLTYVAPRVMRYVAKLFGK